MGNIQQQNVVNTWRSIMSFIFAYELRGCSDCESYARAIELKAKRESD